MNATFPSESLTRLIELLGPEAVAEARPATLREKLLIAQSLGKHDGDWAAALEATDPKVAAMVRVFQAERAS